MRRLSHEVRSGLYGAADADGDGEISYREIGAVVARPLCRFDSAHDAKAALFSTGRQFRSG